MVMKLKLAPRDALKLKVLPRFPVDIVGGDGIEVTTVGGNKVISLEDGGPVTSFSARTGAVIPNAGDYSVSDVTGAAPLASPTFTGSPAAPTPSPGDNDTSLATTAFVTAALAAAGLTSKVISATRDMTAASGNVAYTGVGFIPTTILVLGQLGGDVNGFWGFAGNSMAGAGLSVFNTSGAYTNVGSGVLFRVFSGTAATDFQSASVASYDADGFTLAWTKTATPTGTANINFLCLR